ACSCRWSRTASSSARPSSQRRAGSGARKRSRASGRAASRPRHGPPGLDRPRPARPARRQLSARPAPAHRRAPPGSPALEPPGADGAGSRPYRAGDDVRRIDWHASARLSAALDDDEFVVRELFAEEAVTVVVVRDRRPSMALHPPPSPWLDKAAALAEAESLI